MTEFNKFMQTEIARLKEENPDMPHRDRFVGPWLPSTSYTESPFHFRFKLVVENWNKKKDKELARS